MGGGNERQGSLGNLGERTALIKRHPGRMASRGDHERELRCKGEESGRGKRESVEKVKGA